MHLRDSLWTLLSRLQPLHKLFSPGAGSSAGSAAPDDRHLSGLQFAAVSSNVINLSVTTHLTALVLFKFLRPTFWSCCILIHVRLNFNFEVTAGPLKTAETFKISTTGILGLEQEMFKMNSEHLVLERKDMLKPKPH